MVDDEYVHALEAFFSYVAMLLSVVECSLMHVEDSQGV
jgi:hypothetical protein